MNKNIKIAKQLIKLAKSLIAYKEDKIVKQKITIKTYDDLKAIKDLSILTEDNLVEIAQLYGSAIYNILKTYYGGLYLDEIDDIKQQFFLKIYGAYERGKFNKTYEKADANADAYFKTALKHFIVDYMDKYHDVRRNRKNNIKNPFISINDTQNYIDHNKSGIPGHELQKEELEKQLKDKIFETFEKIKKERLVDFQALYLYYCKKLKLKQIGHFLGRSTSFCSFVFKKWQKFLHDELKEVYQEYKAGPKDILKLSSNSFKSVENILENEEIWNEYIKKYGEPIQI